MNSPALVTLPIPVQQLLLAVVKPKFNAYLKFTSSCTRAIPSHQGAQGEQIYTYPDESMISDLTVLWSLFCEVYEAIDHGKTDFSPFFAADPRLVAEIRRLIEDGEFWHSPMGRRSLVRVPLHDAVPGQLKSIWRTLRNGYAHFHWCYENLGAEDYWDRIGWDVSRQQRAFRLASRPPDNYKAYIADGSSWDGKRFWDLQDLRIIITPYSLLRYHIHRFLNVLLNGVNRDVFGNLDHA